MFVHNKIQNREVISKNVNFQIAQFAQKQPIFTPKMSF